MPTPTIVVGAPCWIDLYCSDTAKATEFYGSVFGWVAQPPQEGFGGYFTFTKDGKQRLDPFGEGAAQHDRAVSMKGADVGIGEGNIGGGVHGDQFLCDYCEENETTDERG